MKIKRGPRTTDNWTTTDTKDVKDYAANWKPGRAIRFDGTIDKSGNRHTDLGVELDEKDVIALHSGLIRHFQGCVKERDRLQATVSELEDALTKISALVGWKKDRAPDRDSLLEAIEEIADHFGRSWNRRKRFTSKFAWMKWKSL